MEDDFVFLDEIETTEDLKTKQSYNILSVDDEQTIHEITNIALSSFIFDDAKLNIVSVNSAKEAKEYLKNNEDISLILLDIVMETNMAGFDVVKYVREDLKNNKTRIVIRTGQAGSLSEEQTMKNFDVDGYTEKTDLSVTKLFSIVYSSLRAYRDIKLHEK